MTGNPYNIYMKKIFLLIPLAGLLSCAGFNEKALERIQSEKLSDRIDEYLEYYEDRKEFSGYVLIDSPDGIIYERGFGHADYSTWEANGRDTVYRIGSITRMMTAAAVLLCSEKGLLSLDDPLSKYIPEYNKGELITIHQILSHTSGIPDISVTLWYYRHLGEDFDFGELLDRINGQKLKYTPGTRWNYSNPNYELAGEIIQCSVCNMEFFHVLYRN